MVVPTCCVHYSLVHAVNCVVYSSVIHYLFLMDEIRKVFGWCAMDDKHIVSCEFCRLFLWNVVAVLGCIRWRPNLAAILMGNSSLVRKLNVREFFLYMYMKCMFIKFVYVLFRSYYVINL